MAAGRRGSDLSEMSQSLAGLRFNMFLIAFPIFFSVLYVQFEHEQSGDFRFSLESSFLPLQSDCAVLNVKMIELSELGVLV